MKSVVFVDVQNDFIDGALRNERAIETTPKIVEFAKECVKNGYKLYATRDTHMPTVYDYIGESGSAELKPKPWNGYLTTFEGKKLPVEHCIEGTDGWMIDNRLMEVLDGNCTFVNKQTFGSLDLTDVIEEDCVDVEDNGYWHRKVNPPEEIILCGFCTDICVISNALLLRAKFPNTKIIVMNELCAGTTLENHEAALKIMQSCQIDIV